MSYLWRQASPLLRNRCPKQPKRLHEHERTVESPMVRMIDQCGRGLTEVPLYTTLGGVITSTPQQAQALALSNEEVADLKGSIEAVAEERPDGDLLVTAEQVEASVTYAALPESLRTAEPEPAADVSIQEIDEPMEPYKGEGTRSAQPEDVPMEVDSHPALAEVKLEVEDDETEAHKIKR